MDEILRLQDEMIALLAAQIADLEKLLAAKRL